MVEGKVKDIIMNFNKNDLVYIGYDSEIGSVVGLSKEPYHLSKREPVYKVKVIYNSSGNKPAGEIIRYPGESTIRVLTKKDTKKMIQRVTRNLNKVEQGLANLRMLDETL
jgi:hypothetical protein